MIGLPTFQHTVSPTLFNLRDSCYVLVHLLAAITRCINRFLISHFFIHICSRLCSQNFHKFYVQFRLFNKIHPLKLVQENIAGNYITLKFFTAYTQIFIDQHYCKISYLNNSSILYWTAQQLPVFGLVLFLFQLCSMLK